MNCSCNREHARRTVFCAQMTDLGGSYPFRDRQSKAHSFCFGRKLNPHWSSTGVRTTGYEPKCTFRFAFAGTNAIGIVCALCKKNREKGLFSCCLFCRNEAVIVGSAAFFTPVSFACCGCPTVAASGFCMNFLLHTQETCLCPR